MLRSFVSSLSLENSSNKGRTLPSLCEPFAYSGCKNQLQGAALLFQKRHLCLFLLVAGLLAAGRASFAQVVDRIRINATQPVPEVRPLLGALGSNRAPNGDVIDVNSQYIALNGKPWIPVMGELHYSRVPEDQWESSILKMKAAGVQIISSYVIWIHHEQHENVFDWKGRKDLRHFAELCARHGMYFFPRIGPWSHGEVRNGGLPDWVLKNGPTRQNDPIYLREANQYFLEIGKQLQGLYWKDGGPTLGIQIENEYGSAGPGKGHEHLRTLKKMAIDAGMDVPLYTETGWNGTAIPKDEALPVFGGYADHPWDDSPTKLPPSEVYLFRLHTGASGAMGAMGGSGQAGSSYADTPFLTAEVGGGIQDTYARRPVVSPDDIASISSIMVGSGVNLLGFYMFHGGRNPDGGDITLQESQRTAYPTDLPVKSYDFQAPLSPDGEERASLRRLKLINYFLNDFGEELAPMTSRAPDIQPSGPSDLQTLRVCARTKGDSGFIFVSNYVRGASMPARKNFSVQLDLPHGSVRIPEDGTELPPGAFGIWPVNFDLGGITLRYSTAQLFKRIGLKNDRYLFFFAIPHVQSEFVLEGSVLPKIVKGDVDVQKRQARTILRMPQGAGEFTVHNGAVVTHVVLMTLEDAQQIWKLDDPSILLSSPDQFFADGSTIHLLSDGDNHFGFGAFGFTPHLTAKTLLRAPQDHGLFVNYRSTVSPVKIDLIVEPVKQSAPRSPWRTGPKPSWQGATVMAPEDADFAQSAAAWKLMYEQPAATSALSSVVLRIRYQGDVARLFMGSSLIDDDFWNGLPWQIALKSLVQRNSPSLNRFRLEVLPLPRNFPMYLEAADALRLPTSGDVIHLDSVEAVPQYELTFETKLAPKAPDPKKYGSDGKL